MLAKWHLMAYIRLESGMEWEEEISFWPPLTVAPPAIRCASVCSRAPWEHRWAPPSQRRWRTSGGTARQRPYAHTPPQSLHSKGSECGTKKKSKYYKLLCVFAGEPQTLEKW